MKANCFQKILLLILCMTFSCSQIINVAKAEKPKKFPRGCASSGHLYKKDALLILPDSQKQTVYLINNHDYKNVQVKYFDPKHPNLGTWNTVLKSRRWSSFAADMPMLFTCKRLGHKNATSEKVNCEDVLTVCQYPRAKVPLHMHGTYFIIRDQYSMNSAVRDTIREGVLLRW